MDEKLWGRKIFPEKKTVLSLVIDEESSGSYKWISGKKLGPEEYLFNVIKKLENYKDILLIKYGASGMSQDFKAFLKRERLYDHYRLLPVYEYENENEWENNDIIVLERLEYRDAHLGAGDLRRQLEGLLKVAIAHPEKLYLLLFSMPESESFAMILELLPEKKTVLPDNVFIGWNKFLKLLNVFHDLLGLRDDTNLPAQFEAYQDMPLMLRYKLLQAGTGMNYERPRFSRWNEYLHDRFNPKDDLYSPDFMRAIALSGGDSIEYLQKLFPNVEAFTDFLNSWKNNALTISLDVLTDIASGLINIVIHVDYLKPYRTQVMEVIRLLAHKSSNHDLLVECYEAFQQKGCKGFHTFLAEEIGAEIQSEEDLDAAIKIIKRSQLFDPWIAVATSLDDEHLVCSLVMDKLSLCLEPFKASKTFLTAIANYLQNGEDKYFVQVQQLSMKVGLNIFKNCRCSGAHLNFNKIFLDSFNRSKLPDFYHRLEKLYVELDIADIIDAIIGSGLWAGFDERFIEKMQHHLALDNALLGLQDVIKYLLYQAEDGVDNSLVTRQLIEESGADGINSLYDILKRDPRAFKWGGFDTLMENISTFPPNSDILADFRADKRKAVKDLAVILEAGCKKNDLGTFLAAYLKGGDKKEILLTARKILTGTETDDVAHTLEIVSDSESKLVDHTSTTREEIIQKAERFDDLDACKDEPVATLPIDFDMLPELKWQEDGAIVPEHVQMFIVNSFFSTIKLGFNKTDEQTRIYLAKKRPYQNITNSVPLFSQKSFEKFIEAMAKVLLKLAKDKKLDTKYVKRALPIFGYLGTDDCFCTFFNGKIEKLRRETYYPYYDFALYLKGSPYTKLLQNFYDFRVFPFRSDTSYNVINKLQSISDIRKIFTDESVLKDDNALMKKKVKPAQLSRRVWKSCEKIISNFYADFFHDSLAICQEMSRDIFLDFFVNDICGLHIGKATVWGVYKNKLLDQTFTIGEQGKFCDVSGNEIELENFSGKTIDVVHPVELSAEDIVLWKNYFDHKGLTPLLEQLDVPVFRKGEHDLNNYLNNEDILVESYWKKKRMGIWVNDDNYEFLFHISRVIVMRDGFYCAGIKTSIDLRLWYETPALEGIKFYFFAEEEFMSDYFTTREGAEISLNDVPDRFYSEICRDVEKYFLSKPFMPDNVNLGDKETPKDILTQEKSKETSPLGAEPIEKIGKSSELQTDDDNPYSGIIGLQEIIQDEDVVLLENNIDKYLKNELEVADKLMAMEIEPYNPITLAKNHLACSYLNDEQFIHSLMQIEDKKLCSNGNLFSLVFESLLVNGTRDAETKLDRLFDKIIGIYSCNSNSSFTANEKHNFWDFLGISMDNMVDMDHPDIIKYINKVREHVDDENREFFDGLLGDDRNESVAEPEPGESKDQQEKTITMVDLAPRVEELGNAVESIVGDIEQERVDINDAQEIKKKINSLLSDMENIDGFDESKKSLQTTLKFINSIINSCEEDVKNEPEKKPVKEKKKSFWNKIFGG